MKKFAFVINVFREDDFHSGGEKLFYEIVNRTIQDGYKADLYCTTYLGKNNILKNKLNKLTFLGHPKDFKYPEKIEDFYDRVKKLIQKENYDFIISENISPPIDIGVLQGHSLVHYRKNAGNLFSRILFGIKKFSHIKAQKQWLKSSYRKIIVPSEVLKDEISRNFNIPEEKFLVIQPGIDPQEDLPHTENQREVFTFGISAPSFGKKGGYIFLKALNILKNRGYNFRAKIIYPTLKKNPWLQFLLTLYGLKENVEFLSYQQDMSKFYNSVDCVVMPSVVETFGLVALEAMVRNKPAIVSSYSGASEIIADRDNGFVFDMKDHPHKNLADKMEIFLNNSVDYEQISKNAGKTAINYNWENFYKKFKENLVEIPENVKI